MSEHVEEQQHRIGRSWRLQRWPTDPSIAHLVFTNMWSVPTVADFEQAVGLAARRGAAAVRTSALFHRAQIVADNAGFDPIEELVLLQRPIGAAAPPPSSAWSIRTMRSWHLAEAAKLDRLAFGSEWGNSAASLYHVLRSTPAARGLVVRRRGTGMIGFAIVGAAAQAGYVQRLAVHPDFRRRGVAKDLLGAGNAWMERRSARVAYVNTEKVNDGALALYRACGFRETGDILTVHQRGGLATAATRLPA